MWVDVIDLRDFYAKPLGRLVQRVVRLQLRTVWPDLTGQRMLGLGFATPFLSQFKEEAERVLAVMPPEQGVMHWPVGQSGLGALAKDDSLPFADRSMDRILLVHALETSSQFRELLRECWRVLADSGRLVVVAPNRRGLWARIESSPFAQGRPYSTGQLDRLLRDMQFERVQKTTALYFPPVWWPLLVPWTLGVERIGRRFFPTFAGAHIFEAAKQIYAPTSEASAIRSLKDYVLLPNSSAPARLAQRIKTK